MDFFQFDSASPQATTMNPSSTTYDFNAISPATPEPDNMFTLQDMSSQMHMNPGNMWKGTLQNISRDTGLGKLLNSYPGTIDQYGQVTPPDDLDMTGNAPASNKRADSGVSGLDFYPASSMSPRSSVASNKRPSVRASQKNRRDSRISEDGDPKKEKYREKNRVAAAKCRAKKKEHVDSLEDNHRTQSALNTALKQTEKSLRDELSFWRTQALQHTFCSCHSIQEYNLQKAQSMAAGKQYGSIHHLPTSSPNLASGRPSSSMNYNNLRSQSSSIPEAVSPVMSEGSNANSFHDGSSHGEMRKDNQAVSMMARPSISSMELKLPKKRVTE